MEVPGIARVAFALFIGGWAMVGRDSGIALRALLI